MGLVVQDIDREILLSFFNNIFDIVVLPAPDGEDKTIQKLLLLITKDKTCVSSTKSKRVRNNVIYSFRYSFMWN